MSREYFAMKVSFWIGWVLMYFTPVAPFILCIGAFIMADMMLALCVVVRNKGWRGVRSHRLWTTPVKIGAASIILLVVHMIEQQFIPGFPALQVVGGGLALSELKSIDEKGEKLFGVSLSKALIHRLGKSNKENEENGNRS